MGSLWEDLRDGIRDGIALVADKTDEYTKIGKFKIDMLGIKRNIEKLFSELGGRSYEILQAGETKVEKDEQVVKLVQDIKELEDQLDAKKNQIKDVKDEKEQHRKDREESKDDDSDSDVEDATVVEETDES